MDLVLKRVLYIYGVSSFLTPWNLGGSSAHLYFYPIQKKGLPYHNLTLQNLLCLKTWSQWAAYFFMLSSCLTSTCKVSVMLDFLDNKNAPELQLRSHLVIHQVLNTGPHQTGAHSASRAILFNILSKLASSLITPGQETVKRLNRR